MNYPNKKKKVNKNDYYANLGQTLESDIELTNQYYLNNNIAVIHKKPTPIQIVDVSYPSRNKAKITKAFFRKPSTTDFNGIYRGKYIDFDAKETNSKTSMPLSNIHTHQVEHLKNVLEHGGIAFFIVAWKKYNEYYLILIQDVIPLLKEAEEGGRKSIPYSYFKEKAHLINFAYTPRLDYLKVVDKLISSK